MRLSLRGDATAAGESVGESVCAKQPIATQRARTGVTLTARITECQGASRTAVVTLSSETAPKGYFGIRIIRSRQLVGRLLTWGGIGNPPAAAPRVHYLN